MDPRVLDALTALWLLAAVHLLLDLALRGQLVSDLSRPAPGVPWGWPLAARSVIQGSGVTLVLLTAPLWGSTSVLSVPPGVALTLGLFDALVYFRVGCGKHLGKIASCQAQVCHLLVKALVVYVAVSL